MASILDVIDNYISFHKENDILKIPGKRLFELGEEVRRFANAYEPPQPLREQYPIYLGGWPSANFWTAGSSELLMSMLLYCGQVLAKDPIADWFSNEQYSTERLMPSRPGYLRNDGSPNVAETRQFLYVVVPILRDLRPLLDAGIVILSPSRRFEVAEAEEISSLRSMLLNIIGNDPLKITETFDPTQIPVEDNLRGMFLCAGGEREEQVRKYLSYSLRYFASEYLLATMHGFNYTAPFEYEQYVCENGLREMISAKPSTRVVRSLLKSSLPLYAGLTPQMIAKIRDDENYSSFRVHLFQLYKDLPIKASDAEIAEYIADVEATVLQPILSRAAKEADHGIISKLGIKLLQAAVKIASGHFIGAALDQIPTVEMVAQSLGKEGGTALADKIGSSGSGDAITIWTKLYAHHRTVETELRGVSIKMGSEGGTRSQWWGIPEKPGMSVYITKGALIWDFKPQFDVPNYSEGYPFDNVYKICPCGSGLKFKFCCKELVDNYGLRKKGI